MFTVKHRAPDGTETLHGCETVTVVGGPDCTRYHETEAGPNVERDIFTEGIFLDRKVIDLGPGQAVAPATFSHVIQFGGGETSDRQARKGGKVWVMNEQGATVATYDL